MRHIMNSHSGICAYRHSGTEESPLRSRRCFPTTDLRMRVSVSRTARNESVSSMSCAATTLLHAICGYKMSIRKSNRKWSGLIQRCMRPTSNNVAFNSVHCQHFLSKLEGDARRSGCMFSKSIHVHSEGRHSRFKQLPTLAYCSKID